MATHKLQSLTSEGLNLYSLTDKPDGGVSAPAEVWQLVVMNEILQELKKLNRLLHCHNFTDVPFKLDKIAKNTTKKKRKPAPKLRAVA